MPCDAVLPGSSSSYAPWTTTISSNGSLAQPLEHLREEESLLGRAEARRLARGEDDRSDAHLDA